MPQVSSHSAASLRYYLNVLGLICLIIFLFSATVGFLSYQDWTSGGAVTCLSSLGGKSLSRKLRVALGGGEFNRCLFE